MEQALARTRIFKILLVFGCEIPLLRLCGNGDIVVFYHTANSL